MIQNVNFLPVGQNKDLSLKLNLACQHKSRDMLSFQNRAPYVKILKFCANRGNSAYLEKRNFQQKLIYPLLNLWH